MNTFYHGDCLFVMNHDIEPNSIDLIYLDPPFFTGKVQKGIAKWQPGAMEVSYDDSKKFWGDTEKVNAMRTKSPKWLTHIAQTRPDFASYLFYMMERLEACHRVLKDTGSIYLHCDWRASHYLKMIMDEIFGDDNFRNEIIWCITGPSSPGMRQFSRKHGSIFWYSKGKTWVFTPERIPYKDGAPHSGGFEHGLDPKTYEQLGGKIPEDWWSNIAIAARSSTERVGYPTQKPLALLERIIKASSNEGDVVLDPFCGCGTAIIAAQRLNRKWIGIDVNKEAHEVSGQRIGELPLDFTHYEYVSRDLDEVLAIDKPAEFEKWVNGYFKAHKPSPDKGVDGITPDGIPIQTKTFKVNDSWVRRLVIDARHHPSEQVKKPVDHAILVSQQGFDDSARQMKSIIQNEDHIKVDLLIPSMLLSNTATELE